MYQAIILPLAKKDIQEAAKWYNSKQKGLGKRFTSEIRQNINLLKQNPHSCAARYNDIRTSVLSIFPFIAYYIVDEQQKLIVISAVLHTSRHPDTWKREDEVPDDNI
jgi:plasmid stabilization system protein ParE